ncbi:peptidase M24 [Thermincola ferriacetica]|uniref:Peptidase M24 n=1 Tax=Thermincola ferriacetica TaxID=281456 RepID=A0A0L6W5R5_9FIRM|nr:Xaa-Pro peptidase family protein [Thermincola ferriacetica]KNZ70424.1 peptidase M24 [Thermincola ferriacetica]
MLYTPQKELFNRITKLQTLLREKDIDGALIVKSANLFYFSGTAQNAYLFVPAEGAPVLLVKKSFSRAKKESALENIMQLVSLKKIPAQLAELGCKSPATLGLEMDSLPASTYLFFQQIFPGVRFTNVSGLIREIRQIKSEYEINLLRTSASNMDKIYRQIPGLIKEGMAEIELAAQIEGMARTAGHMGYISMHAFNQSPYFGHLLSGESGAVPSAFDGPTGGPGLTPAHPQGAGWKKIKAGEPISIDYVGLWDGYITDQTRIFSIGPLPEKLQKAFDLALEIQAAVVEQMKPGANGSDLHELSLAMAAKAGFAENYMGYAPDQARFLGHGVGLELDELPVLAKGLDARLQPGMVIAIEPKFVFPGKGVVGIENTFAITEQGAERITVTPDELVRID